VNKTEFIELLARNAGTTKKEAEQAFAHVVHTIGDAVAAGDKVALPPLGTFHVVEKPARKGRNPATGQEIEIPARRFLKFKPAKNLQEVVTHV